MRCGRRERADSVSDGIERRADARGPQLGARSYILTDYHSRQVLVSERGSDQRVEPASITKIMSAVVCVESDPDLSQVVTVELADAGTIS